MIPAKPTYIVYGSKADKIRLSHSGDWHLMNVGCAEEHLKADLEEIKSDPFHFWTGAGDYCDYIGYRDRRFNPAMFPEKVKASDLGRLGEIGMEWTRDLMEPIKERCIGLLDGNHERKYELATDNQRLMYWLCTELGVPYLGYSSIFDIVFVRKARTKRPSLHRENPGGGGERWRVRIFAHHGAGWARTTGGKINRLEGFMEMAPRAHIVLVAHVHEAMILPRTRLDINENGTEIVSLNQVGAITGSYLRTYAKGDAGYGEVAGYKPVPLGAISADMWPHRRTLAISQTIDFTHDTLNFCGLS